MSYSQTCNQNKNYLWTNKSTAKPELPQWSSRGSCGAKNNCSIAIPQQNKGINRQRVTMRNEMVIKACLEPYTRDLDYVEF